MATIAAAAAATKTKNITGSCHCKYIQYEISKPAGELTQFERCNCTMCQKPGFAILRLDPTGKDFHLISPAKESEVKTYQLRPDSDKWRFFCDRCGCQVWMKGRVQVDDQEWQVFSVNANTVDQPQDGFDLSKLKVVYIDGLFDTEPPVEQDHPHKWGMP